MLCFLLILVFILLLLLLFLLLLLLLLLLFLLLLLDLLRLAQGRVAFPPGQLPGCQCWRQYSVAGTP